MDDSKIVELFFKRDENAIKETENKYKRLLFYIANNILDSKQDSEECVSDTYLRAWNTIPPNKPQSLASYLGSIVRNLSIDMYKAKRAQKRGGTYYDLAYEELEGIIADEEKSPIDDLAVKNAINGFLEALPQRKRIIFVQRYWYLSPIKDIARNNHMTEVNVKVTLLRLKRELEKYLRKEGVEI